MDEDPLQQAAEAAVAAEREAAREYLERLRSNDTEVLRAANAAHDRYWNLAGRSHDRKLSPEAEKARRELLAVMARVESMGVAIAEARTKLERLEDPLRIDQWVRERRRPLGQGGRETTATPRRLGTPRVSREVRSMAAEEAQKQAVRALKEAGGDFAAAAKALNDAKIKTSSGKEWTPRRVKVVTSKAGVEAPAREPKAKKESETTTPPKKNGGGEVIPIDKKSQASGTSRGGTGSRKKASSTPSRAKRGSTRRGR